MYAEIIIDELSRKFTEKLSSSTVSAESMKIVNIRAEKEHFTGIVCVYVKSILKLVNAEISHVSKLTDSACLLLIISNNCTAFDEAPIGVHKG